VVLLSSRAVVDFSVSGLENPLVHVLIVLFVGALVRHRAAAPAGIGVLWLIGALLYVSRPDAVILVAPVLIVETVRAPAWGRAASAAIAGLAPAVAWTAFAVSYYGFAFPNTAYAKLANGIDRGEMWTQGWLYLVDSVDRDPITLATVGLALGVGATVRGARALSAGLGAYLVYIASIGGDFMAGRFVSAPCVLAVAILTRAVPMPAFGAYVAAAALALVGTAGTHQPLWLNSRFDDTYVKPSGTVDERAVYIKERSLLLARRGTFRQPSWPVHTGTLPPVRAVETCGLMGRGGMEQGPFAHMLDECALADPLLARLPAIYNDQWRPGHFRRMIPDGYRESVESGENRVADPGLSRYYDRIRLVTRGTLWSSERWRAIWHLSTHGLDPDVNRAFYRHAGHIARLQHLTGLQSEGTPGDALGTRRVDPPLAVLVDDRPGRRYLDASLDSDDRYFLVFLRQEAHVAMLEVPPVPEYRRQAGLAVHTLDLPAEATRRGFDTIVISAAPGDDPPAIGHLLIEGFDLTDAELARRVSARDRLRQAARQP
jgi:arabinofuranosyltransferase